MNFKRLEIYGFKSFAEKLKIDFDEGITAIVGPNGCGKSNVADAIRWALGEQSPKTLRGTSMADVIFNGTSQRKSLSYCEVLLYFDNKDRIFNSSFDEIVISRKLYRNGESEYSINKTPCRLKDITALLHDSGLGRDSYSIIGQGRIDEILSAKPENRRAIFEDAAGITKYKQIKVENERKLIRVEDKLTTAVAVLNELENSLEPLKAQAEKAHKYLAAKERQKHLDINNYIIQFETAEDKKRAVMEELSKINDEIEAKQKLYDEAYAEYSEAMQYSAELDENIKKLNDERLNLSLMIERAEGEQKLIKEKINFLLMQNDKMLSDNDSLSKELELAQNEQVAKSAKKKELSAQIEIIRDKISELNNKYIELSDIISRNDSEIDRSHKEAIAAMTKMTDLKAALSRLEAESEALKERVRENEQRADSIKGRITETEIKAIKLGNNIAKLVEERDRLKQEADKLASRYNEKLSLSRELGHRAEELNGQYNRYISAHKMLSDIENDMRNYNRTIKDLMTDAKTNPALSSRIECVVAKAIRVKPELETAIEMALGSAIQNIITKNEEDAKYLVRYLKDKKLGRATFLPITAARPRRIEPQYRDKIKGKGCLGIASELIEYDSRYENIFCGLLGSTVVCDNMDTAVALAKGTGYAFKIVTLDGDIITPSGAITGGSKKSNASNLLSGENELRAYEKKINATKTELEEVLRLKSTAALEAEQFSHKIKELTEELNAKKIEIAAEQEKESKTKSEVVELNKELERITVENQKIEQKLAANEQELKDIAAQESIIDSKQKQASEASAESQKYLDGIKRERDKLHMEINAAKDELSAHVSEFGIIDTELKRIAPQIENYKSIIQKNIKQIETNRDIIESAVVPSDTAVDPRDVARLKEVTEKLSDLDVFKRECQEKLVLLDKERLNIQQKLDSLKNERYLVQKRFDDIDNSLQIDAEKMQEEYGLDYSGCLQYREPNYDITQGLAEANRIRREIIRMGYVNPDAIQEYEILKRRVEEERAQKEDLEKSIIDIRKVIKDMVSEMIVRFEKSFEQINANFSVVFRQLFGGGNAKLILEEAEDPLEAGIEIIAEPPGKKLQSISLLSGGERALTAIAILFAILKLRPMPFCVLDEIEAALDDANAERFAKYLQNFSKKTQFIVITHRKPTMELSDSLYGVTMEEQGVSKVVSVRLEEAVKTAETVPEVS